MEFIESCHHAFGNEKQLCEIITVQKVNGVMIYTCHCSKKGASYRWSSGSSWFRLEYYKLIMERMNLECEEVKK